MANAPVALNIFNGQFLWQSVRDPISGTWQPNGLVYTSSGNDDSIEQFSAGSVANNAAQFGIIAQDLDVSTHSLVFIKNGPPFTPVLIPVPAGDTYLPLGNNWEQPSGAFYYSGSYFVIVEYEVAFPTSTRFIRVLKSTDGGSTWAPCDTAHEPKFIDPAFSNGGSFCGVDWDGSTNLLSIVVTLPNNVPTSRSTCIFQFDMSASTWSSQIGSSVFSAGLVATGRTIRWPNGDVGVIYNSSQQDGSNPTTLRYREYTSGSWGSEIQLRANPYNIGSIIEDWAGGVIHVFAHSQHSTANMVYFRVNHGGTFDASDQFTFPAPSGGTDGAGQGAYDPVSGLLLFPYDSKGDGTNAVWECPAAGPYTFVKKLLPIPSAETGNPPSCAMVFFSPVLAVSCPMVNTGTVGSAFTATLGASGGSSPYTFAISGLPPGLSLNTTTGVISGTPLVAGSLPYTATVTDSLGARATNSCSLNIARAASTCNPKQITTLYSWQPSWVPKPETIKDRFGDWTDFGEASYVRGLLLHADTFGANKNISYRNSDDNTLHQTGGPIGTGVINHNGEQRIAYYFATPFVSHIMRDESQDLVPWRKFGIEWIKDSWPELTDIDSPWLSVLPTGGAAFLQGLVLPLEAAGALPNLTLRTDSGSLISLVTNVTPALNVKTGVPYSLATPTVCHQVQIIPAAFCRYWWKEIQWVAQPTPELVTTWTTPWTGFGIKGFKHMPRIEAAWASSATVTLTITSFDGTSPTSITLPSTGGVMQKLALWLTFNKGQLYKMSAVSSAPFQIFMNDFILWVAEWGRLGYSAAQHNLGAIFGDQAPI